MDYIIIDEEHFYPSKEVAKHFKMNSDMLNAWLRVHDSFRENRGYIVEIGGGKKPKRFFTKYGIEEYKKIREQTKKKTP